MFKLTFKVFFVVILFSVAAYSQQTLLIDSLESRINTISGDSALVMLKTTLAREYIYVNLNRSEQLIQEAFELASEKELEHEKAYVMRIMASVLRERGAFVESIGLLMKSADIFREYKDSLGLGNCYLSSGHIFIKMGNSSAAAEEWSKAVEIFSSTKDEPRLGVATHNLARGYYQMGQYDSARKYLNWSIPINKAFNNLNVLQGNYLISALTYYEQQKYDDALTALHELTKLQSMLGDKASAGVVTESYLLRAAIAFDQGQTIQSIDSLQNALNYAYGFGYLDLYKKTSRQLLKAYELNGDRENMMITMMRYMNITDSLMEVEKANKEELVKWYKQMFERDKQIEEYSEKLTEQRMQLFYLSILVILFIIILLMTIYFNRKSARARKLLLFQKNELEEANESKRKLFSIISHDLLGPAGAVYALGGILEKEASFNNNQKEIIREIVKSSESLYNLLSNLLSWSKSHMDKLGLDPEIFYINELVQVAIEEVKQVATNKRIALNNEVTSDLVAFADRNHVLIIIRNLLMNAIKFSSTDNQVIIKASVSEKDVRISIVDFGVGMNQDKIKTLFNVSEKTSTIGTGGERGNGIGLNLAKEFAIKNRGDILVDSQEGEGSKFTIVLPSSN